jgi:hypothetical protein
MHVCSSAIGHKHQQAIQELHSTVMVSIMVAEADKGEPKIRMDYSSTVESKNSKSWNYKQ